MMKPNMGQMMGGMRKPANDAREKLIAAVQVYEKMVAGPPRQQQRPRPMRPGAMQPQRPTMGSMMGAMR